jgi:hypothetical protein
MRGRAGALGRILAGGLCLFCFALAQTEAAKTAPIEATKTIINQGEPWNREQGEQLKEAEASEEYPVAFLLWGEKEQVQIVSRDLSRTGKVSVIEAYGDSRLILKETVYLDEFDQEGCLLSEDIAWKLFGSTEAVGEKLQYGERTLTVRGILRNMKETLFVEAAGKAEGIMNTVTLKPSQERTLLEEPSRSFMMRHGIQGQILPVNYFSSWARLLVFSLPLFLFLRVLKRYGKEIKDNKGCKTGMLAAAIGMTVLFIYAFGFSFQLPKEFIPSRWSDFQFWHNLREEKGEELLLLLQMRKRKPELLVAEPFFQCLKYMAGAWACYGITFGRWKDLGVKEVIPGIILAWVLVFLIIMGRKEEGSLLIQCRNVWFLLPYELTGRIRWRAEKGTCSS